MKYIVAIIFAANVSFAFCQWPNDISKAKNDLPDKIKKVQQYQDDILLNVREYDTLKNEIFRHYKQYWDDRYGYLTMITGNIYDNYGNILKSFSLHSNAGLSISYFEYDSYGNNTKVYIRNNRYEHHDSLINKRPYRYISEIKNFDELIDHPKIKEIELVAKKYLLREFTFDSIGNKLTEITYSENGDTIGNHRNEYDKNNNRVYSYQWYSKENHREYYCEYEPNFKSKYLSFGQDPQTKSIKRNLVQTVRIDYDWREKRKRVWDNITFYKYDNEDRLVEDLTYRRGEFKGRYVSEYNNLNLIVKKILYFDYFDKISQETTYSFNKEGYVIEETETDFRSRDKNPKMKKYRYEYGYYK